MKPEVHYVYVYVNTVTGHAYVGRTKDLKKRHRDHQSLARKNKGWTFHQAIRDHGIDSFVKLVPFSGTKKDAMDIEVSLINDYKNVGVPLYNETDGGHDIDEVRRRGIVTIAENRTKAKEVA